MCSQKGDHVKTQWEDGHLQEKERDLRRNQPTSTLTLNCSPQDYEDKNKKLHVPYQSYSFNLAPRLKLGKAKTTTLKLVIANIYHEINACCCKPFSPASIPAPPTTTFSPPHTQQRCVEYTFWLSTKHRELKSILDFSLTRVESPLCEGNWNPEINLKFYLN